MRRRRDTIGAQLDRIKRLGRKHDPATGMLYTKKSDLKGAWNEITLFTLFVSDENTFLIRPHVFAKREPKTAPQWHEWFREHYGTICREGILPGMANRTGKFWRVYRVIGWVPGAHSRSTNPPPRGKGNKTKRSRR